VGGGDIEIFTPTVSRRKKERDENYGRSDLSFMFPGKLHPFLSFPSVEVEKEEG